jgi:hypothetical protein
LLFFNLKLRMTAVFPIGELVAVRVNKQLPAHLLASLLRASRCLTIAAAMIFFDLLISTACHYFGRSVSGGLWVECGGPGVI